jgi:hypothetical protein
MIGNSQLIWNPQSTWKQHKNKDGRNNAKLATLLLKVHSPNKVGLD